MDKKTKVATCLKKVFESSYFTVIKITLTCICAYLAFCISTDGYAKALTENWGKVGVWIISNGGSFIFFCALISATYQFIQAWADKYANSIEKDYQELLTRYDVLITLLERIEKIVAQKRQRFADLAKKFKTTPQRPQAKTVFTQLTQPDKQIKIIMQSLEDCLKHIYPKEYIKLALMRVEDRKLVDWEHFLPYNAKPRTSISELQNPCSTIARCLKERRMQIVADTQSELKKQNQNDRLYVIGSTRPEEQWSQLCHPVISINSNEVIFIISLAIKRANVFNASGQEYLEWLLGFFESRLALEHSLKELKELTT